MRLFNFATCRTRLAATSMQGSVLATLALTIVFAPTLLALDREIVPLPGHDQSVAVGAAIDEAGIQRVFHVDAERGDDAGDGTQARPMASLAAAVSAWAKRADQPTRIVLAPGTYRIADQVVIPGASDVPLIIESTGNEPAVLSGWRDVGPDERRVEDAGRGIYSLAWPHNWEVLNRHGAMERGEMMRLDLADRTVRMRHRELEEVRRNRVRKGPNQVGFRIAGWTIDRFVNPLTGDGGGPLKPGEFGVAMFGPGDTINGVAYEPAMHGVRSAKDDRFANRLFFRLPQGVSMTDVKGVRVNQAEGALRIEKSSTLLRHLVVEGFGSQSQPFTAAAVVIHSAGRPEVRDVALVDCVLQDNAGASLATQWLGNQEAAPSQAYRADIQERPVNHITLRNCRFDNNGGSWNVVFYATDSLIEDCTFNNNGWAFIDADERPRGKSPAFHPAIVDTAIRRSQFNDNHGNGFCHDTWGERLLIEDCTFNNNDGNGLRFEVALGPIDIRRCEMIGNKGAGMFVANTDRITVEHSRIINNGSDIQQSWGERDGWNATGAQIQIHDSNRHREGHAWRTIEARSYTHDFVLRDSVVATDDTTTGPNAIRLIDAASGHDIYSDSFVPKQFTGERNTYWHPATREVFVIEPRRGGGNSPDADEDKAIGRGDDLADVVVDLEGWQKATGSDVESVWQMPESFNSRGGDR